MDSRHVGLCEGSRGPGPRPQSRVLALFRWGRRGHGGVARRLSRAWPASSAPAPTGERLSDAPASARRVAGASRVQGRGPGRPPAVVVRRSRLMKRVLKSRARRAANRAPRRVPALASPPRTLRVPAPGLPRPPAVSLRVRVVSLQRKALPPPRYRSLLRSPKVLRRPLDPWGLRPTQPSRLPPLRTPLRDPPRGPPGRATDARHPQAIYKEITEKARSLPPFSLPSRPPRPNASSEVPWERQRVRSS